MTSHELFATMPTALASEIIDFNLTTDKPIYRAALDAVAQSRRVRLVFMERMSRDERHDMMLASLARPHLNLAADGLIRNWLLKKHSSLLIDFLNALGIPHDKGVVESLPKLVPDDQLHNAVNTLLDKHPAAAVAVYLHAFNSMNDESWANLDTLLQSESRLHFRREG